MTSFAQLQTEDRRLVILRLLSQASDYRANIYLLQSALVGFGHHVSLDSIAGDLAWLDEQGLLNRESTGGLTIAKATQRGVDVAAGRANVPGVKRPAPGE